jgi:hypothetical protein
MSNPVINRRLGGSSASALINGLISYWPLETTAYADIVSGNNLTATNGGVSITPGGGIIGSCAAFSAGVANSVLSIADSASVGAGSGVSFTISGWTTYFAGYAGSALIAKWDGTHNDFRLLTNTGNYWCFSVTNLAGTATAEVDTLLTAASLGNVGNSKWYHLAAGYDDAMQAIWIQVNGGLRRWASCVGVQRTAAPFTIGNLGTSGATPFGNGGIDECALWHRSLSADEINLIYNMGLGNQYPFHGLVTPGSSLTAGTDWANRVVTNGGATPGSTAVNAVDDFLNGLVVDGIAGMIMTAIVYPSDNLTAAITPIIALYGNDPWTNSNFVSGDLTVNGLAGNTTTKSLATGLVAGSTSAKSLASYLSSTSMGMTVYLYDAPSTAVANGYAIGSGGALNSSQCAIIPNGAGATTIGFLWRFINVGQDFVQPAQSGAGYYSLNRIAANKLDLYHYSSVYAHASLATASVAQSGAIETVQQLLGHAINANGVTAAWYDKRISFMAIHQGLTSAQSAKFALRIQTLRTALGGGYV